MYSVVHSYNCKYWNYFYRQTNVITLPDNSKRMNYQNELLDLISQAKKLELKYQKKIQVIQLTSKIKMLKFKKDTKTIKLK